MIKSTVFSALSIIFLATNGSSLAQSIKQQASQERTIQIADGSTLQNLSDSLREAWVRNYTSGFASGSEYATAIVSDNTGNVYVTGYSHGAGTGYDYATIKYNSSGVQQWAARYNGTGNGYDKANAIAIDDSGNVFVTGESKGAVSYSDYATVKYNSSGVQQWVARYNGTGNYNDYSYSIVLDDSGNVYVTGYSYGSGTIDDYATVKYNSSGVQQWAARYNGPDNSYDQAYAIAVDTMGTVYVTGFSESSNTAKDYATVKYNSSGVEQWVVRYNSPDNLMDQASAIAVDASSNVYVTGWSWGTYSNQDYVTVKYNSAGEQQWSARYNGTGKLIDYATAIAVDTSGNVYVTGASDGSNLYSDYATVKYNNSGVEQWTARYDGPGMNNDAAQAIALDASGNVYVTGGSRSASGVDYDFTTVKYNSSGAVKWIARYNNPNNTTDYAYAIAVDASDNVYVTGCSMSSSGWTIYTTIKYEQIITSVSDVVSEIPNKYTLEQNYPNPFNPATNISFNLPSKSFVSLKIFDALGREVATVVSEEMSAGSYSKQWNATNMPSGIYFYRLQAESYIETKKMILLR